MNEAECHYDVLFTTGGRWNVVNPYGDIVSVGFDRKEDADALAAAMNIGWANR